MKKIVSCTFLSLSFLVNANKDLYFINTLNKCVSVPEWLNQELYKLAETDSEQRNVIQFDYDRPLFDYYPGLKKNVPHISFAQLPTPVQKLEKMGATLGIPELYIKQDSQTGKCGSNGKLFGGNKLRKLEFLLADALAHNAKTVMTFGAAGSNHTLATCTYAKELGLKVIAMFMPQPKVTAVQRNLLLDDQTGAQLLYYPSEELRSFGAMHAFLQNKLLNGDFPYVIPTGGSCPVGIVGIVNAAFELKEQIKAGELPTPDIIVVPSGSYGTVVGLLLGGLAADMQSRIFSVAAEPEAHPGYYRKLIASLFQETNAFLHEKDSTFALYDFPHDRLEVLLDFCGAEYGDPTKGTIDAIKQMKEIENVHLDTTYSGKAFSSIIHCAKSGALQDKKVLFWNTYSEYTPAMQKLFADFAYKKLPTNLHCYFE